ncbi:hypothetical protein BGW36DRAFT_83179 [Talaromyces proteolyticus]|uniref:Uncharacterized protein n=1 Tax=Talaromyces proteolyticus TaxID=1131652 RepID=A0AAD4Q1Z2_9EURO|nr:uncharacterized protein BGW36DRAFT_83179 [Talaromyces proteolyticus]KAH8703127.1 hypothetical protein BGW36DRAFT_83179 [Talaromyces proteolyticus]
MSTHDYKIYPPSYSSIIRRCSSSQSESTDLYSDAASDATTIVSIDESSQSQFCPGRSFQIDARGIGLFRFPIPMPVPDFQMEIPIFDHTNNDRIAYVSRRSRLHSGDAVLSDTRTEAELVETKYFFGPGRDPILHVYSSLNEDCLSSASKYTVPIIAKWTSRTIKFTVPRHDKHPESEFEWSYGKRRDTETGNRTNLIVLRHQTLAPGEDDETNHGNGKGKIIAEFGRSKETRTAGSTCSTAGNGGLLIIDRVADEYLDEAVVVATCLVMLKREIDRRRMSRMAFVSFIL